MTERDKRNNFTANDVHNALTVIQRGGRYKVKTPDDRSVVFETRADGTLYCTEEFPVEGGVPGVEVILTKYLPK